MSLAGKRWLPGCVVNAHRGRAEEAALGHAEAMFEIADAVTQCKFEASDKDTDEVVLYKILQVRMAAPTPSSDSGRTAALCCQWPPAPCPARVLHGSSHLGRSPGHRSPAVSCHSTRPGLWQPAPLLLLAWCSYGLRAPLQHACST